MRKISANYICPVSGPPLKNGIVEIDQSGKITNVIDTRGKLRETAGLEFYNGIIVPGFINAHCHLEFSYMKNRIPEKCGLDQFIFHLTKIRSESTENIEEAIKDAHNEMVRNGIVAVGDISNTTDSFPIKTENSIQYHTFLEIFSRNPEKASKIIQEAFNLSSLIKKNYPHSHSIVPHAPYSVSSELLNKINSLLDNTPLTIHNQESMGELLLFKGQKGPLYKMLTSMIPELKDWVPKYENSLEYILNGLNKSKQLLLVHNTFSGNIDISKSKIYSGDIYWIFCPIANLYIEDKLPDIPLFMKENQNIALGTDSLASNHQLSILEEMKVISDHYPEIPLEELIKWGTLNGAKALNMENKIGSIEINKNPGLNLISNLNLPERRLTGTTRVRKIC